MKIAADLSSVQHLLPRREDGREHGCVVSAAGAAVHLSALPAQARLALLSMQPSAAVFMPSIDASRRCRSSTSLLYVFTQTSVVWLHSRGQRVLRFCLGLYM